jgi:hypothetical protein
MRSKPVAALLVDLEVAKSHSCPCVCLPEDCRQLGP